MQISKLLNTESCPTRTSPTSIALFPWMLWGPWHGICHIPAYAFGLGQI
ncbi:hypothetical protein [Methanobacterium petrolearium]|nr:hypothetical protein [Methanobacterium petrolearium]MBP1947072.1 hypothetical protein [Methanobacterium petrolearium]